jgi:TRAP-type mannitol/chloroaromatic compound transport system permease small subunit
MQLKGSGGSAAMLLSLTRAIDRISQVFSYIAIFLVLVASMVSAFNALFRYSMSGLLYLADADGGGFFGGVFDMYRQNSNTLSEAQWYMFTGMVMLGGAWTLKVNEHVRVDLIYGSVSERTRTWIDFLGGIFFLLPMCVLMVYFTWPWFMEAWISNEGSLNAGGLTRWPVKLLVPVGFCLLGLQGIAEVIKCYLALTTDYVREFAYEKPLQ